MSKVQMLLSLKKQRLTAAAEEIFALFEKTIAELEEELSLSKEENERLQKLLDAVLQPQLRIHSADVQLLEVVKEEVLPDQQDWSTSLDQEDPEPTPHIKQEQEEHRISQEGEQLEELEEADIIKSTFTPDPVKSEGDKEKPQSSQPHQRQTEHMETKADGDDCGGPEPARNSDPESSLQPKTEDDTGDSSEPDTGDSSEPDSEDSSEPDTEDSADWKETREPAGSNSLKNRQESVSDSSRCAVKKQFGCSVCTKSFAQKQSINRHMRIHTGEKPHSCSVCEKSFSRSEHLKEHLKIHTGEKPHSCSVCEKSFSRSEHLKEHMRIHTGEKPHSCSVCEKSFSRSEHLKEHMRIHTGEKRYRCSVCKKSFSRSGNLKSHMRVHTGEEIYSCNVCDKRFKWRIDFKRHKCVGRQSSQLNEIQTEDNGEAEPPISSSAEHMETEADGEDHE
ncbi:zinc finger protein 391-like [Pseudochaenichthys georgianus]|uniref:zinc finger protein 391-like n=1 Tax=Pseudochaenichthys georgianus TaxID=52239 RepID=UPI0039C0544F